MKRVALGLCGILCLVIVGVYWQQTLPIDSLNNGKIAEAQVKGLAFKNPELVKNLEASIPIAPKILNEDEKGLAKEDRDRTAEEVLIPLTKENISNVSCVLIGPIDEKSLPKLRIPLKTHNLTEGLIIENVPVRFSIGVVSGPFISKERAQKEILRLESAGNKNLQLIVRDGGKIFIKFREFSEVGAAEIWARELVTISGLKNIRLTRLDNSQEARIRVVFPNVDENRADTIRRLASRLKISVYQCPID